MKSGQVTIKDLAKELNVSCSTVSRALKDFPGISEKTKKAAVELAAKYNYRPNSIALSLRNQKTNIIGVIIPEIVHFFFSTVISGIEDEAMSEGYNIMVCQSTDSFEREADSLDNLVSARVDGLLVSVSKETTDLDHLAKVVSDGTPLVFFDRLIQGMDVSSVTVDDYKGAFEATEHLVHQGCKSILHLAGPKNLELSKNRLNGYKDALAANGIEYDDRLVIETSLGTREESIDHINLLFDQGTLIDGIFACNDMAALGAMEAVKKHGLSVPDDVGIVGFSNWQFSSLVEPALSSVFQPGYEMGREATKLIIKEIESSNSEIEKEQVVLDTGLVVRGSSTRLLEV